MGGFRRGTGSKLQQDDENSEETEQVSDPSNFTGRKKKEANGREELKTHLS